MKNLKTRNPKLLLFLLGMILLMQTSARTEIGMGTVLGTAWTIGNVIIGQTTITPAYAVESYTLHHRITGHSPYYDLNNTRKVKRDLLGNYFYYSKLQYQLSDVIEHTLPFPVTSLNKLNMTCQRETVGGTNYTETYLETHKEFVWLAQVEQTGLWPDNGPWTVWLKTSGQRVSCISGNPKELYFWVSASVGKSGGKSVSLGNPNSILNYPFYLASDFYK